MNRLLLNHLIDLASLNASGGGSLLRIDRRLAVALLLVVSVALSCSQSEVPTGVTVTSADTPTRSPGRVSMGVTVTHADRPTRSDYDASVAEVGKWRRHVITLPNNDYSGNPFELEVDGTFVHEASGTTVTLPGYYAGDDEWKIGFMPTEIGEWTYVTSSSDPQLDGVSGRVLCIESGLPGMLKADSQPGPGKKWKFTDGPYVVPIGLRMEFFSEPAETSTFTEAADFMRDNHLQMLETRLTEQLGQFEDGRHDFVFEGDWGDHQFDLRIWDRMEERMEILTERGLGAHIMFYSDDAGKPDWPAKGETEWLVIRYVVARLAGYPIVWYNTGIDIAEYRDCNWTDWFAAQIHVLDPYGHPVSSRHGGGSGSCVPDTQTWDSRGDRLAKISDMIAYYDTASVPVSMDDAWGENRTSHPEKNFRPQDIRRAFWKSVAAGGLGGLIRGSDGYFHIGNVQSDLESEQWLRLVNEFVQRKLGSTFGAMTPSPSLVSNGYALADPGRTKIVCFFIGTDDRWDDGNDGPLTADLTGTSRDFRAIWFDPRTGSERWVGPMAGGKKHVLDPPSADDWVLYIYARPLNLDYSTYLPAMTEGSLGGSGG